VGISKWPEERQHAKLSDQHLSHILTLVLHQYAATCTEDNIAPLTCALPAFDDISVSTWLDTKELTKRSRILVRVDCRKWKIVFKSPNTDTYSAL
jgi:hypothetical protein